MIKEAPMPVMHMYKDKPGWFILTNLGGNIVTFQLTEGGQKKLAAHGIAAGKIGTVPNLASS